MYFLPINEQIRAMVISAGWIKS